MINKHKKFLTAAVFCAIASTGFVLTASAEETMTHDLDEVVVEADKDALPGLQGQAGLVYVHMEGAFHAEHIFKFLVPVPRHRVAGQIFGVAGDGKQGAAVLRQLPAPLAVHNDIVADV